MKKLLIISILFSVLIFSCSGIQKGLINLSQEDLKNAETTRTIAKSFLSTWLLNSGFIKGSLGSKINLLPNEAIKAIEELDKLAIKTDLTDYDLGYSIGLRVNLLSELIANALRLYAPEILKYIPLTF